MSVDRFATLLYGIGEAVGYLAIPPSTLTTWAYGYERHAGDTPEGESARELVVVRNNQRVFIEVVELYLRRIDFAADGYAQLIRLPQYRASEVTVDPDHEFGRPRFAHGGSAVDNVIDLFRAGEPVDAVAEEFGLSRDEVEDAIRVATRAAA